MKAKLFSLLSVIMLSIGVSYAESVQIEDLYYNLDNSSMTAEVTGSCYSGISDVIIPVSVSYNNLQYRVTSIGDAAFRYCQNLTSVTIPNSVTTIGFLAFYSCSNLTSVNIGNSVGIINEHAFTSCPSLSSIIVDSDNTTFDSRNNCNAIIETASNTLILGCQTTIIPNSITGLGYEAFSGSSITAVTIASGITSIGESVFDYCNLLTSIVVDPDNAIYDSRDNCNAVIETASNTLIAGCQTTFIPNGVKCIGQAAFRECFTLTSINIPNSVSSIGNWAFSSCYSLTSIVIPNSVTSMGYGAFYDCSGLTSVRIGEGVHLIDDQAFAGCSGIRSITIPKNVDTIMNYGFGSCVSLSYVVSFAILPPVLHMDVFSEVDKSIPLYVPTGSVQAYRAADGWNEFTNIRAISEEEIVVECGEEYLWRRMVLTESGDYADKINDSTVTVLHLTLIQPEYVSDSMTIYDNDSLVWQGRVLRESGLYCDTIISKETGCDSLIICLELTVLPYVPPTVTIFGEEVVITDPEDSTVIVSEVDILGDSTLIYTPADNTLTLSDVLMEAGDSITAAISYTGSDPLTIVLCDSSTIVADTVISSASDIIITGTGTLVAEGVVPIVGAVQATITFDSVSMIVRSLSSPAAVRRRIRGGKLLDENGGPALSGFATADFNKTAVTPPEAEYGEVKTEESSMLEENTNALFVRNADGTKTVLTEFVLTAIADKINDAVENISEEGNRAVSKCLIDGRLYILLPDGTRYTATGLKVE